jgi:multidrug efflux pump
MSLSSPFIHRPVGTTLLTIALALAGALAYQFLPVSPLPQVEFPTIQVSSSLPGASPETMASSVATPLERQFGRIAGVTEMTSNSSLGSTMIVLQFDLSRNIDAAARDVQAAINAARGQLPANLPNNPTYRKVNPADAPILILALTSETYGVARMYDAASSILQQKLSQLRGVGQVLVGGGSLPAVRVDVNPGVLNHLGLGLEDVRSTLANANTNRPKGEISGERFTRPLATTDQLFKAGEYRSLIVAYVNGAPIRLSDVASVEDSVEDIRTAGLANGKHAVLLIIWRQPGANIIDTVDRVRGALPQLKAEIPAGIGLAVVLDRTVTIRDSVRDVQWTLVLSIGLVILVVFLFLRSVRTTIIPSVAVPVSLIGTFGVMYLAGYSIDNLSLMALTIATGFVVDDAIVVAENITRYLEQGVPPMQAALRGAREIGFTVISMSLSLVAVFIPILLMGGIVGRLFREFAVTLSVAIAVSMVVSLTTTPMMCAWLLRTKTEERHGLLYRASEHAFQWVLRRYEATLSVVLRHRFITLLATLSTVVLTVYLYVRIPKGFFPQQDTGRLVGSIMADQDISFLSMQDLLKTFSRTVGEDPEVDAAIALIGGSRGTSNTGLMFVTLKSKKERPSSAEAIIGRLRSKVSRITGGTLVLQPVQDLRIGGRVSAAQYQYTLQGDNLEDLVEWAPKVLRRLRGGAQPKNPAPGPENTSGVEGLVDISSDQQNKGLQAALTIDRPTAARMGLSPQQIDNLLYDAFGQRQVSTIFAPLNQYHVVMEVDPRLGKNPEDLRYLYARAANGSQIPLASFTRFVPSTTALGVPHSGQFPSVTISFNLQPGVALGDAVGRIEQAVHELGMPATIHGNFSGTAQAFQESLSSEPYLIAAALLAVYIVLGILYESLIHPVTILSTLPSAGVGALLALLLCRMELNVMGLIGIVLLIGIVKKNAIMMIDFAIDTERKKRTSPEEAIFQACLLRFRPIVMTTMAALLGGLPLALGTGSGSELRRPLGIAIVGGLIFSQVLTLYTTPVVYLYLDRLRLWLLRLRGNVPQAPDSPTGGDTP